MIRADPSADPFAEHRAPRHRVRLQALGAQIEFASDSKALLALARAACAKLPPQRLHRSPPRLQVRLLRGAPAPVRGAPAISALAAPGLLAGAAAGASFMAVNVAARSAVVLLSPQLLRAPRLARYELLEFALYCLAARVQQLAPLHAACVAAGGSAALVLGSSGAGKSTLVLHALLAGLELLAEDSVLVEPRRLRALGLPAYVHVRPAGLRFLGGAPLATAIRRSPVIVRRSGVRKYELDARASGLPLARGSQRLRVLVFLSSRRAAGDAPLCRRLPRPVVARRLRAEQPYAAAQPGWQAFVRAAARLPAFELQRGRHPRTRVAALAQLLELHGRR